METSERKFAPLKKNRPPQDINLDEVLRGIRGGDSAAVEELERQLSPGIRLIIRRRNNNHDAQLEAQSVLDAAVREIRADLSLATREVILLVRHLVQQRFPANGRPPDITANWDPGLAARSIDVAGKIL